MQAMCSRDVIILHDVPTAAHPFQVHGKATITTYQYNACMSRMVVVLNYSKPTLHAIYNQVAAISALLFCLLVTLALLNQSIARI